MTTQYVTLTIENYAEVFPIESHWRYFALKTIVPIPAKFRPEKELPPKKDYPWLFPSKSWQEQEGQIVARRSFTTDFIDSTSIMKNYDRTSICIVDYLVKTAQGFFWFNEHCLIFPQKEVYDEGE